MPESVWEELRNDNEYALINRDELLRPDGGLTIIETRWTGVAEVYGPQGPMIFTTTVHDKNEIHTHRYASLAHASKAHFQLYEVYEAENLPRFSQVADEL